MIIPGPRDTSTEFKLPYSPATAMARRFDRHTMVGLLTCFEPDTYKQKIPCLETKSRVLEKGECSLDAR